MQAAEKLAITCTNLIPQRAGDFMTPTDAPGSCAEFGDRRLTISDLGFCLTLLTGLSLEVTGSHQNRRSPEGIIGDSP
jgi:hypothetical protein